MIAPQMLPYDPPYYDWDSSGNVQFQFQYELFMPQGILWQFIVEMNDEIKDELVWRYGVILDFEGTEAEVIEENERNLIKLRVRGPQKEDIRAVIIRKIEEINRQFKKLKPKKLVPCVCEQCKNAVQPYMFRYDKLIDAQNKHEPSLQCHDSYKQAQISQLLSGIEFLEEQKDRWEHTEEKKLFGNGVETSSVSATAEKRIFNKKKWLAIIVGFGALIAWLFNILGGFPAAKVGLEELLKLLK